MDMYSNIETVRFFSDKKPDDLIFATLIYLTSRDFTIVLDEVTQLRDEPILNSHRLGYPPSTNIRSISYCLNQDQQEGIKIISILFVSTHINVQINIWTYTMISPSILAGYHSGGIKIQSYRQRRYLENDQEGSRGDRYHAKLLHCRKVSWKLVL